MGSPAKEARGAGRRRASALLPNPSVNRTAAISAAARVPDQPPTRAPEPGQTLRSPCGAEHDAEAVVGEGNLVVVKAVISQERPARQTLL